MKLLLDECLPKTLKHNFLAGGHECSTVPEAGFAGKTNGQLLALAVGKFEVFVTLDKGVQFQQCLSALLQIKRGEIIQIGEKRKAT